ncbi:MAG TPA: mandelate racemase/muconate lactonizing enzyme family protein [Sphingomicrobium sp.]|nr:mandelate racemase/muconate lactonizing enzyme family protein [Sphingomicrobium sp.]
MIRQPWRSHADHYAFAIFVAEAPVKIAEVHIYTHGLPVKNGPYTMATQTVWELETTLVKLVADNGLVGWGETCALGSTYQAQHALGARAALQEMAPGLIGENLLQPLTLRRRMNTLLDGHNYAKAAVDIAGYDLMGKHYGVRVADLLGGVMTERLPSYYAIGIGEPDEVARIAADKIAQGFPRLQLKVGGRPIEVDIEVIRKLWERVGHRGVGFAVDANRGLLARDVLRLSRECPEIPFVIEQPCNTMDEIASIRHQLHHAVYLDENTDDLNIVLRAISYGLCDGFGMKVTRIGGLHAMATFRDICEARSLPHTCDDNWGGDLMAAACAHIGATVHPRLLEGVWIAEPYIDGHFDSRNGVKLEDGHIQLPQGPGLGILPDENIFGEPAFSAG